MTLTLPERVDARRLAAQGTRLSGELPVAALPRLTEIFTDVQPVTVAIDFSLPEGRVTLRGRLQGRVTATCQRCLQPVTFDVTSDFEYLPEDEQVAVTALEPVSLERESPLDLLELIEDEILLACPMVSMHPEGQCQPLLASDIADRENPFDVLSALRQNRLGEPGKFDPASNSEE
jgi:uncharacterized protein